MNDLIHIDALSLWSIVSFDSVRLMIAISVIGGRKGEKPRGESMFMLMKAIRSKVDERSFV